jgi:hypothetical protein
MCTKYYSRITTKFTEIRDIYKIDNLIPFLNKNNIEKLGAVCRGTKILAPIVITSSIFRFILPVGSIYVADFVDKYIRRNKGRNNGKNN